MSIATINPNIQGGVPCFTGTRVPVVALLDYLDRGYTVAEFLADFPSVRESQVHALLEQARADVLEHAKQAADLVARSRCGDSEFYGLEGR